MTFRAYLTEQTTKEYIMYFKGNTAEDLTYEFNSNFEDEDGWEYDSKDKSITVYSKKSDKEIQKILKDSNIKPTKTEVLDYKLS